MRTLPTTVSCSLAAALLLPALAGSAAADPTGAKNSFAFPARCSHGTTVADLSFVVNSANGGGKGRENNPKGQASWSPAHVVGSNLIFHPTVFDLTFSFTTTAGQTFSFLDDQVKPNGRQPVSCTIDTTQTDPDGSTFSLKGTVAGYFS